MYFTVTLAHYDVNTALHNASALYNKAFCQLTKTATWDIQSAFRVSTALYYPLFPELLLYIVYLYIRSESNMQKKPKEPQTPGHKSNQTQYGECYSYLYILRYYSDSCRSYHLLKEQGTTLFNEMNIFWPLFIFKFECTNGTCMFEELFIVFITSCHWIKQSFWLAFIGGLNSGINAL